VLRACLLPVLLRHASRLGKTASSQRMKEYHQIKVVIPLQRLTLFYAAPTVVW